MKFKKLLALPIIFSAVLVAVPGNLNQHNYYKKTVNLSGLGAQIKYSPTSYGKYLENMHQFQNKDHYYTSSGAEYKQPLLGYGYDLVNQQRSRENAFTNYVNAKVKIIPLDSSYDFSLIDNESDLSYDMGINAHGRFGWKHFGVSKAATFKNKVDSSVSTIQISFRMKTDIIELFDYNNKAQLSNKAKTLLDNRNTKDFYYDYFDKYVVRLYATREILFNLNITVANYSVSSEIRGKLRFNRGLNSLADALALAKNPNNGDSNITLDTLALPHLTKDEPPMPTRGDINGSGSDQVDFLKNIQKWAANHINLSDVDKNDPTKYFAKGVKAHQLDDYNYYHHENKLIQNPNINILSQFGQLNQYYDLYQNMAQDLNKFKLFRDCEDNANFKKNLTKYVDLFNSVFNDENTINSNTNNKPTIESCLSNHNIEPLKKELKSYSDAIFNNWTFSHNLRMLDWFLSMDDINISQNQKVISEGLITNKNISKIVGIKFNHTGYSDEICIINYFKNINENFIFSNFRLSYNKNSILKLFMPSIYQIASTDPDGMHIKNDVVTNNNYVVWNPKVLWINNLTMNRYSGADTTYKLNVSSKFGRPFNPDEIFLHPM